MGALLGANFLRFQILAIFMLGLCGSTVAYCASASRVAVVDPRISDSVAKNHSIDFIILRQEIERALGATRQFAVLTRDQQDIDDLLSENDIDSFRNKQASMLAVPVAADFIIVPTVTRFAFYSRFRPIPRLEGRYSRTDHGDFQVAIQVIATQDGRVTGNFDMQNKFSTNERVVNRNTGSPSRSHFNKMTAQLADEFADNLINTVFPMRVVQVNGRDVYINRGTGSGLKIGDILKVYRPGKDLIDPYSGEVLGTTESFLGTLRVLRVNPKSSVGEMIEGGRQSVSKDDLLRRPQL